MLLVQAYLQSQRTRQALSRRPGEKGFSLIELVVVIAVLAILTAIALPNFLGVSEDASARTAQQALLNAFKECKVLWARNKRGSSSTFVPPAVTDWAVEAVSATGTPGTISDNAEYGTGQEKTGKEVECFTQSKSKDIYVVPADTAKFPIYKIAANGEKFCKTGNKSNTETFNIGCDSGDSYDPVEGWK